MPEKERGQNPRLRLGGDHDVTVNLQARCIAVFRIDQVYSLALAGRVVAGLDLQAVRGTSWLARSG